MTTSATGASAEFPVDRAPSVGLVKTPTTEQALGAKANEPPATTLVKSSPEEKLSTLGLSRVGAYFLVASETEILEKFDKVRPLIASMAQPFNMFAQAMRNDMLEAEAEDYFNEMKARVDAANAILSKMPNGARSNSEKSWSISRPRRSETILSRNATAPPALSKRGGPSKYRQYARKSS